MIVKKIEMVAVNEGGIVANVYTVPPREEKKEDYREDEQRAFTDKADLLEWLTEEVEFKIETGS